MEIILQQGLEHQQIPVDRISKVFENVSKDDGVYYSNPTFNLADGVLKANIKNIQQNIHPTLRGNNEIGDMLNLDIKMETGTGKTYVYTKTIYELHKCYGINKFIIIVPSLAIKAGAAAFIGDSYVKRHFKDECGYNAEIDLNVLEAKKAKKKGKDYYPAAVRDFVQGSNQLSNKIYVLLLNMQLLGGNTQMLKNEYDYPVEGFYRPYDALQATKPFVIIDEPHRFARDNTNFKTIVKEIKPQCLIRFGATFPQITVGKGKSKQEIKDYQNLLYDLNACDAFNKNLVKGIAKEHFEPLSKKNKKVKILRIESKKSVTFKLISSDRDNPSQTLFVGDSLYQVSPEFEWITVKGITDKSVIFSNDLEKFAGNEFDVDVFMESYQEGMMRLALERHFETERANFNRKSKIKTLALFFIDDIYSYRESAESEKPTYLKEAFEKLLKERIKYELQHIASYEQEYKKYLEASLADINACHAGYFAQDNSDSDEAVAQEIKEILFDKKGLLSLKKPDGVYNTRRFLFSKWTLKEGWDNPNVFTIAKLRSSGSEISKLQEVGRGLRLPVDEYGNRISSEDFTLNYIVDFTERDFAEKLISEINSEVPTAERISKEKLAAVAKIKNIDENILFATLLLKTYVDAERNIIAENRDKFFAEFPEFASGIGKSKIADRNKKETRSIKIRSAVYKELKELWLKINEKYLLFYEKEINAELDDVLLTLLEKGIFQKSYAQSSRVVIKSDGTHMFEEIAQGVQYSIDKPLKYNEFLFSINKATHLPITVLHKAIVKYVEKHGEIADELFNEFSVNNFIKVFFEWKDTELLTRFSYTKATVPVKETALSNADGTPKTEIVQGRIGIKSVCGTPSNKYLYDVYAFDSPLEENNITADIDEVVVYGKIPKSSIAIPTITGGFYSPDFMYVVKKSDGTKILNIVIETKDVEGATELRGVEGIKIKNAQRFFEQLSLDGYQVQFKAQLNNKKMRAIIDELLV